MTLIRIILLSLGILFLIPAIVFFIVWLTLNHMPDKTARTSAKLSDTKHKKNVTTYQVSPGTHAIRKTGFIKDLTKVSYLYTVDQKSYRIREDFIGTPRQSPLFVPVVYLKTHPRFAYIDTDVSLSRIHYGVCSFVLFIPSILLILGSIFS